MEELVQLMKLSWHSIKVVNTSKDSSVAYLLDKFSDIFTEKLGMIKCFSAKLSLNEGEEPIIFKPGSVSYAKEALKNRGGVFKIPLSGSQ